MYFCIFFYNQSCIVCIPVFALCVYMYICMHICVYMTNVWSMFVGYDALLFRRVVLFPREIGCLGWCCTRWGCRGDCLSPVPSRFAALSVQQSSRIIWFPRIIDSGVWDWTALIYINCFPLAGWEEGRTRHWSSAGRKQGRKGKRRRKEGIKWIEG